MRYMAQLPEVVVTVKHPGADFTACEAEKFSFDPFVGAEVLYKLAELAGRRWSLEIVGPDEPIFACALGVLGDAKRWLEQFRTPFETFAGDGLLLAERHPLPLTRVDTFADVLQYAALELITVARLIELRESLAFRTKRAGEGT